MHIIVIVKVSLPSDLRLHHNTMNKTATTAISPHKIAIAIMPWIGKSSGASSNAGLSVLLLLLRVVSVEVIDDVIVLTDTALS